MSVKKDLSFFSIKGSCCLGHSCHLTELHFHQSWFNKGYKNHKDSSNSSRKREIHMVLSNGEDMSRCL